MIKVLPDSVSRKDPLPASYIAVFSPCLHLPEGVKDASVYFFFFWNGTNLIHKAFTS